MELRGKHCPTWGQSRGTRSVKKNTQTHPHHPHHSSSLKNAAVITGQKCEFFILNSDSFKKSNRKPSAVFFHCRNLQTSQNRFSLRFPGSSCVSAVFYTPRRFRYTSLKSRQQDVVCMEDWWRPARQTTLQFELFSFCCSACIWVLCSTNSKQPLPHKHYIVRYLRDH